MSEEVLRFYQRGARGGRGLRLGRRRPPYVRYTLLALLIGLPATAWWLTRDTWDMGRLIPGDQHYSLLFPDLIEGRKTIARSPLWEALPPELEAAKYQQILAQDFGLPEWLINNVAVGAVHVSGKDMEEFRDALIVSRMTRLGALLQRFSNWSDMVVEDHAGGLELMRVRDAEVWLAVRGRVMLASRDRDTLIRALVLTEEEALGEDALQETLRSAESEMLQARVRTESVTWASPHVTAAGLQCWLSDDAARAVLTCRLGDASRETLTALLAKAKPVQLRPGVPGALRLSVDIGIPAAQAWQAIAGSFGAEIDLANAAESLIAEEARSVARPALRSAIEGLGNGWSLSYRGINQLAFAPMPRFALLCEVQGDTLRDLGRNFPKLPEGVPAWQSIPRLSADGRYVELPLIGGPDLQPVFAPYGDRLLIATALPDAQELLSTAAPAAAAEQRVTGNLWLELESAPLVQDVLDTGLQLAELSLIRGHTPDSLAQWFVPWQQTAQKVPRASLVISHDNGTITMDLRLTLAPV